jgi:formylglycine-generating enzyme required for sulfatase activity
MKKIAYGTLFATCVCLLLGGLLRAQSKPIVAVFDFEVKRLRLDKQRLAELSAYFADSLAATGALSVVPRDQLRKRLTELKKKSYKECYDQSCQVEIGRELAASKTLATRLMKIGSRCVVTATLYDLRKAASEGGATAEGGCGEDALRESLKKVVSSLTGVRGAAPSADAGVRPAPRSGKDTCPMARVPAGPFVRGSPAGQGDEDERPQRTIHLDAFAIDTHEVTVAQYRQCVRAGACAEPKIDAACNWTQGDRGNHPVTCVDWQQAKTYCEWVGKRLPTEAEWERAARGAQGRAYPWGDAAPSCKRAVMSDDSGPGCGKKRTFAVGSRSPHGDAASGLQDLAGNVSEWVNDWYHERYYHLGPARNPPGPAAGKLRVYRGGSWQDDAKGIRSAARDHNGPTYRYPDLGFRCARSGR